MRLRLLTALAAALAASVLAAPAPAAPAAVRWVAETAYVPTPDGEMYVELTRPERGRAPVLLRMTPDGGASLLPVLSALFPTYDPWEDHFRAKGYVPAMGHILGTGRSGGCWDLAGPRQAAATAALVEWLGTRPWSNGRVALVGEWGVLDTATLAPRHLAAIVPVNAVSSWYHVGYDHGVSHLTADNDDVTVVHTASGAIDGHAAKEPLPRHDPLTGPADPARDIAEADVCDAHTDVLRAHTAPAYDEFWRARDWALRAGGVRAPVLMEAGWQDVTANATQFARYWAGLRRAADRRAIVGQWDTQKDTYPGGMPLDPESNFPIWPARYLELFLDRHLKGVRDPLLDRVPKVLTESSDQLFRSTLPLDAPRTSFRLVDPLPGGSRTFVNTGTQTSRVFKRNPAAQAGFVAYGLPVTRDTRLTGSGEAVLRLSSSLPRGQAAVTLLDLPPGATEGTPIARGLLDLRFRNSLSTPEDVPTTGVFTARVALRPTDYVLRAGHRLVVAVAGSDVVWGVPDPVNGQVLTVHPDSVLRLPLADPAQAVV